MTYPTQTELEQAGHIVVDAETTMDELARQRLIGLVRERFPEAQAILLTSEVVGGSTWWTVDKIADSIGPAGKTLWWRWEGADQDLDGGAFLDNLDNTAGYLRSGIDPDAMTIRIEEEA